MIQRTPEQEAARKERQRQSRLAPKCEHCNQTAKLDSPLCGSCDRKQQDRRTKEYEFLDMRVGVDNATTVVDLKSVMLELIDKLEALG